MNVHHKSVYISQSLWFKVGNSGVYLEVGQMKTGLDVRVRSSCCPSPSCVGRNLDGMKWSGRYEQTRG